MNEFGSWEYIKNLDVKWQEFNASMLEMTNKEKISSNLLILMKRPEKFIYKIKTKCGNIIKVSGDHPVFTEKNGMVLAENLTKEDRLITYPFSGVKHEDPSGEIILTIEDVSKFLDKIGITNRGNAKVQIINRLKETGLLPLKYNSPQLPILIKIMGFVFGDGVVTFLKNKKGFVHFYGKSEDLESIRDDLKKIGLVVQNIFTRDREHSIDTFYGNVKFKFKSECVIKKSTGFAALLACLGTPYGKKTHKEYRIPEWLMKSPLWQKRLFLASFFGAELSKPTFKSRYCYLPQLNMNKYEKMLDNGIDFLNDIRLLLSEFGIISNYPVIVAGNSYDGICGKTIGLRITIKGTRNNLIKLYENVGYEYNLYKKKIASLAISYLKEMNKFLERKKLKIINIHSNKLLCKGEKFPIFQEYVKDRSYGDHGFTLEHIESIEKVNYDGDVYDFTINHKDHNFIANNFVVSNCGMRLLKTDLTLKEVQPKIKQLVNTLFELVPVGVGCKGFVKLNNQKFNDLMESGAKWCIENGYGWEQDLERIEDYGTLKGADSKLISDRARGRGLNQLGTLGSGNHYLEVQVAHAEHILDEIEAKKLGIVDKEQVLVMLHCGSRGFGHQVATDYLKVFENVMKREGINVPDRELSCAPFQSKEGQDYYKAMKCAGNMAYANRQVITHQIREGFKKVFNKDAEKMGMELIYDCTHNLAREHKITVDGKKKNVLVHLKGATTSVGPGYGRLTNKYKDTGSLIIIGGSMETGSYLLKGTKKAEEDTFGTTAHGAGRTMSRTQAKKSIRGDQLQRDMEKKGIYVKGASMPGLAEEWGKAYKDVDVVIDSVRRAGISSPIIKLVPIGNLKGTSTLGLSLVFFVIGLIVLFFASVL